jgi:DNA-binding transcriptional MerR regulator
MLKIGVFAQLAQVSIKTLRHYDEVGLLRPTHVDEINGYWHYSLEQLTRLNRILALKNLGFSLEQIDELLNAPLSSERIRDMLHVRQAELQTRLQEEQERLAQVAARLKLIEEEGLWSQYDVRFKRIEPQLAATMGETLTDWGEVYVTVCRMFDDLREHAAAHHCPTAPPMLSVWEASNSNAFQIRLEAALPLQKTIASTTRIRVGELPGTNILASTVHYGDHATLHQAQNAIVRWVEANHYQVCAPLRHVYLRCDRQGNPADNVTEVQFFVEKLDSNREQTSKVL